MALEGRLRKLEDRLQPEHPMRQPISPEWGAVIEEFSDMKAMMCDQSYRGSPNGLVKIEPRDVAREFYGREYTNREFLELSVLRALKNLDYPDEKIDERLPALVEAFAEWVKE
jgi:hypothetical protein